MTIIPTATVKSMTINSPMNAITEHTAKTYCCNDLSLYHHRRLHLLLQQGHYPLLLLLLVVVIVHLLQMRHFRNIYE